jgi:hypothetical protein
MSVDQEALTAGQHATFALHDTAPTEPSIESPEVRRGQDPPRFPELSVVVLTCAVTLLAYLPVLFATYGISDDYYDLLFSARDNRSLPNLAIAGGRPVSGFMQEFALSLADSPGNLRWLRLVGILGTIATALVAAVILQSFGGGRWSQLAVALSVVSMPSSQVIASWAVLFPVGWGTALGLAAGFSVRWLTSGRIDRIWIIATGSLAIITTIGLANYQPSAMAFAPGLALALIDHRASFRQLAYRAGAATCGAITGCVAYLVLSRLLIRWRNIAADPRSTIELPGVSKLRWFLSDTLPRSLDPLSFEPRPAVVVGVSLFIVAGLLALPGDWWRRCFAVVVAVTAVISAYAPSLLVAERWPTARSRVSVDVAVAVFVVVSGLSIGNRLTYLPLRNALRLCGAALVAGLVVLASWRVTTYYAQPQAQELRMVSQVLRSADLSADRPVVVIAPNWSDHLAPAVDLDEFGFPSMATSWGVYGLIQVEMINDDRPMITDIRVVRVDEPLPPGEYELIDLASVYAAANR